MSRGFKRMHGFWVGPLRIPQVVKCTHYVSTSKSHRFWEDQERTYFEAELYRDIAESSLREMFLHGEEEYVKLRTHFMFSFADLDVAAYFPTYKEAHENFFSIQLQTLSPTPGQPFNLSWFRMEMPTDLQLPPKESKCWDHFRSRSSCQMGVQYYYSGSKAETVAMSPPVAQLCEDFNEVLGTAYNSCLINKYQAGGSIPFHMDDELGLCKEDGVLCLTFCGDGILRMRPKGLESKEFGHPLKPGDIYILEEDYLRKHTHARTDHQEFTISLTFRRLRVPEV